MNYRLNTTFAELNNENDLDALTMVGTEQEQFFQSQKEGNFPGYVEPKISFRPSYKLEFRDDRYKEKKNQAPSYTDRVLFKNNSSLDVTMDHYTCLHGVYGSDHRPVQQVVSIHNFGQPQFAEIPKLLDMNNPNQGYGQMDVQLV